MREKESLKNKIEKIKEYLEKIGKIQLSDFPKARDKAMTAFQKGYIAGQNEVRRGVEAILNEVQE